MLIYNIEQYETRLKSYTVKAEDEAEALALVLKGEVDGFDHGLSVFDDRIVKMHGMDVDILPEGQLEKLRRLVSDDNTVPKIGDYIPSIRIIELHEYLN